MKHYISQPIAFGNDMSRLVRGIAIILMVTGHSLPGKVIGFAVPLFSFLVGYGYAFAKQRSLAHSAHRVWHLLSNYWVVLLGICLPAALISYPKPIQTSDVLLGMFGLNPKLNFFAWYIYFYIFAMAMLPVLSRVIDKLGWKGVLLLSAICGLAVWGITTVPGYTKNMGLNVSYRCLRYLPIVLGGYWLARFSIFSRITCRRTPLLVVGAIGAMVGIYFLRGVPYAQVFDLLWAPLFAACVALLFGSRQLRPLRWLLNQMGLKSMHIWFLHALFFTHSTKGVLGILTGWIHSKPLFIIAVLVLSFVMAVIIDKLLIQITATVKKIHIRRMHNA